MSLSITEMLTLTGILLALAALPSLSVALVVARSSTAGVQQGVTVAIGIALADLVLVLLAVLGLAVVAQWLGSLFVVVRYLGAVWLIVLGALLLCSGRDMRRPAPFSSATSHGASLLAGFLLTFGDIKALLFYLALFPQLVDVTALTGTDIVLIALITLLTVGAVKVCYALLAGKLAMRMISARWQRAARPLAGGVLVGMGVWWFAKS